MNIKLPPLSFPFLKSLGFLFCLLLPVCVPDVNAQSNAEADKLLQQVGFVEKLLNDSAAAKKIREGSDENAKKLLQQANDELQRAKTEHQNGNYEAAAKELAAAKQTMFSAMRSGGSEIKAEKHREDFQRRYQSAEALLTAHKNFARENNLNGDAIKTEEFAEEQLKQAQQRFSKGENKDADELLESAYLSIKLSLTRLRSGQTIVRSLNFANKEEEYHYEIDRNNTHKMLVEVVLKEKIDANPSLAKLIDMNMQMAAQLRGKAEQQAQQGDFESAIETLENSTLQIIRAIRAAGIYIPG